MLTKTHTDSDGYSQWAYVPAPTSRPAPTHLALRDVPMGLMSSAELAYVRHSQWETFSVTMERPNPNAVKGYTLSDISAITEAAMIAKIRKFKRDHLGSYMCACSASTRYYGIRKAAGM